MYPEAQLMVAVTDNIQEGCRCSALWLDMHPRSGFSIIVPNTPDEESKQKT